MREKAQCWSVSTRSSNNLVEESTGRRREWPAAIVSLIRSTNLFSLLFHGLGMDFCILRSALSLSVLRPPNVRALSASVIRTSGLAKGSNMPPPEENVRTDPSKCLSF